MAGAWCVNVSASTVTPAPAITPASACRAAPSLTIKSNPDPLRQDPVTHVENSCVGCGLCGENAHAAILCPSFYRARIVSNPTGWEKFRQGWRARIVGWMQARDNRARMARAF